MPAPTFEFVELGDVSCSDIAQSYAELLIGHVAVNTSWDSGLLIRPDWRKVNGYAVSPPLTRHLIDEWPVSHDDFCDEWWIFDNPVPDAFRVEAFCNYVGMTISNYRELDFEGGVRLDDYLNTFDPLAVFGSNEAGYIIKRA